MSSDELFRSASLNNLGRMFKSEEFCPNLCLLQSHQDFSYVLVETLFFHVLRVA